VTRGLQQEETCAASVSCLTVTLAAFLPEDAFRIPPAFGRLSASARSTAAWDTLAPAFLAADGPAFAAVALAGLSAGATLRPLLTAPMGVLLAPFLGVGICVTGPPGRPLMDLEAALTGGVVSVVYAGRKASPLGDSETSAGALVAPPGKGRDLGLAAAATRALLPAGDPEKRGEEWGALGVLLLGLPWGILPLMWGLAGGLVAARGEVGDTNWTVFLRAALREVLDPWGRPLPLFCSGAVKVSVASRVWAAAGCLPAANLADGQHAFRNNEGKTRVCSSCITAHVLVHQTTPDEG